MQAQDALNEESLDAKQATWILADERGKILAHITLKR